MASVRELKKDIDYLIFEVISDCFVFAGLHPDNKTDKVSDIVDNAVNLRNDLITRVNNPEGKGDPKVTKAHYQKIKNDLTEGVDKLFNQLSSVSKKKG